jgi:hypothetical protein
VTFAGSALFLVSALAIAVAACSKPDQTIFHGVRLGMAARDVRDRFDVGTTGEWKVTPGEEMLLDWSPAADGGHAMDGPVASARFEFHSGMLVAIRADLDRGDPSAGGGELTVTGASVAAREPLPKDHVSYTLLARDCPTHKAEEQRLLSNKH